MRLDGFAEAAFAGRCFARRPIDGGATAPAMSRRSIISMKYKLQKLHVYATVLSTYS